MNTLINPFTDFELKEMLKKQRAKEPFKLIKMVTDEYGEKWYIDISGKFGKQSKYDVLCDDYYVCFDRYTEKLGFYYPYKRFTNFDNFKDTLFQTLKLRERL